MRSDTPNPPEADPGLAEWLAAARTDVARRTAPAWLEAQLLARFDEAHALRAISASRPQADTKPAGTAAGPARAFEAAPARPKRPRRNRFGWWLAAPSFALIALAVAIVLLAPADVVFDDARVVEGASVERPRFIALAPLDDISAETAPRVVSARIPRAAIAGFGLPIDPARADQPLNAELLMSARGVVLAVRFLD